MNDKITEKETKRNETLTLAKSDLVYNDDNEIVQAHPHVLAKRKEPLTLAKPDLFIKTNEIPSSNMIMR
ncbi:hypothetical protein RCL_jg5037.t1 [Rhizophagus clarus]|uniref:Uncharacterized protein n=1 Tax=Rhizophagus clarus TaxID=94130 RepID=A0A8H3L9P4_9GLOM|nr:hypothetical protein RCL_jg5037.t1 [Rhizophagus clarus]